MRGRAGAAAGIAAVLALAIGMAWWGKRPAERPRPAPRIAQPSAPGGEPPVEPPDEPPVKPPDPPPVEPPAARGWRFGDDVTPFLERGPFSLRATCGECHATPGPGVDIKGEWPRIVMEMKRLLVVSGKQPDEAALQEIQDYYVKHAPARFERLPSTAGSGALEFRREAFGNPMRKDSKVANVNVADLDGDGKPEVVVCDGVANAVSIVRHRPTGWMEEVIASCEVPVHSAVFDADRDGDLDIAVAGLGNLFPTDNLVGSVLLLVNAGPKGWERRELLKDQPRVADVEPADVDGDGDVDLVVAAFGWRKSGSIGWLRNDGAKWELMKIADRPGAIHVPVADLDADGRPDFVALVAQEAETVTAYMNKGGTFEAKTLFDARNPQYGSSGLQLADLDRDGDLDILFSNGDALDNLSGTPKPYHGVQWLENRGKLEFEWHDIGRCYGPYRAAAADLDGDGDSDVAVAVLFGMWTDSGQSGLLWYENDGKMSFTRHDVPSPSHLVTLAAGDLDGDGALEIVTGRMTFENAPVHGEELLKWSISRKK
ncbi:MAG: FG-GAP repeat domain-containing [Planctomycetota bacterium]|nr:MAG: FG-GAP repeat domain-containing [Planctomycetota bacterium]